MFGVLLITTNSASETKFLFTFYSLSVIVFFLVILLIKQLIYVNWNVTSFDHNWLIFLQRAFSLLSVTKGDPDTPAITLKLSPGWFATAI